MRVRALLLLTTLILLAAPAGAQHRGSRWALTLHFSRESFGGASSDTTSVPGTTVHVYPGPRLATELGLGRRAGPWDLWLGAGYGSGDLRARTDVLVLDDHTAPVREYRGTLLVGRRVLGWEGASLHLAAGPVLNHWTGLGFGDRTTVGVRGGVTLRVPLGRFDFENRVLFGLSPSPFQRTDLPAGARREALRSWSLGVGLRTGL
jgi:hypothetical protein